MDKIQRYFSIVDKINAGLELDNSELEFFASFTPEIDEAKINKYLEGKEGASPETFRDALLEASRKLKSSPEYKDRLLKISTDAKGKELSDKITTGASLLLAGTDVANSIAQIKAANSASRKTRKPSRPAIPQRDNLLAQALRQAQDGNFEAERAIAPVRAEIQDQYQSDLANAKLASTGQAGAYGAYTQLAADRRNRAALNLAPIQDQILARQQQNYNNLLGMRMDETQQMFNNEANLYNTDLDQYNREQQAIASLGAVGRENLRGSLYNLGSNIAQSAGNLYSQRKYRNLKNQLYSSFDPELAERMFKANVQLDQNYGGMGIDDSPEYFNQMY